MGEEKERVDCWQDVTPSGEKIADTDIINHNNAIESTMEKSTIEKAVSKEVQMAGVDYTEELTPNQTAYIKEEENTLPPVPTVREENKVPVGVVVEKAKGVKIKIAPTRVEADLGLVKARKPTHTPKWDRCVEDVKKKGDKVNPYAVCTSSIGKDSFLKKEKSYRVVFKSKSQESIEKITKAIRAELTGKKEKKETTMKSYGITLTSPNKMLMSRIIKSLRSTFGANGIKDMSKSKKTQTVLNMVKGTAKKSLGTGVGMGGAGVVGVGMGTANQSASFKKKAKKKG